MSSHDVSMVSSHFSFCALSLRPVIILHNSRHWVIVKCVRKAQHAWGPISNPKHYKLRVVVRACDLRAWEAGRSEVQGHPQACNEFETSLGYLRLCLKTRTTKTKLPCKHPFSRLLKERKNNPGAWDSDVTNTRGTLSPPTVL